MRSISICLLVLLACANATSLFDKYPMNFGPKRSIMTLLTQVESQMKNGGPLDSIVKMLGDFVTAVTEEQIQHDNLHAEQQAECASEFAFREKEVSDSTASFKEATETLDGCKAQNIRAIGDLASTKKSLSETRSYLAVLQDSRKREAYSFATNSEVYQQSSRAVDEAIVILEEIWAGESSLVQLAKHTNSMIKNAVITGQAHHLAPVMAAFAQLGRADLQLDEALFERIKSLLNGFKGKLQADFSETAAAESAAIAAFNDDEARLTSAIAHLEENQLGLETEITELEKCIVVQTGIVQSSVAKRDRNQKLLDDATALCSACDEEYVTATEARKQELELLAAIRERVEARFAQLSEGVTQRGTQDEFTYDNATSYDNAKFEFQGNVE